VPVQFSASCFGLGFEALWEYMRFGSHVSLVTVGVGVTYSF